ncbi:hypothetical protein DAPPUDRAFT_122928, partial [Daphnia pulex]
RLKEDITEECRENSLTFYILDGTNDDDLLHFDVVITTYAFVVNEERRVGAERSELFLTRFDRVILDDAEHLVFLTNDFDPASTDTPIIKVVCSLRGARKWLSTNSPLRISDFPKFVGFFEIPEVMEFCS